MAVRAAFFDVGDTLVEHWKPREAVRALTRAALVAEYGEREWLDALIAADIEPRSGAGDLRQETVRWYREWFRAGGIDLDGLDVDRVRSLVSVPLDQVSSPVPGAFEAVRWCRSRGLRVVLVTNTLSRGDVEVLEDWRRFGLADAIHGVVSSHSAGWRKPHPAIFARALEIAGVAPDEVMHVGDRLWEDVWGAKRAGLRAVWRRIPGAEQRPVDVEPDLTLDGTLHELPRAVAPWL
ncbi:MAG TPA: HAD family hydrolase [Candidatus Limnocylindrales bacterium]|nr:HAD family hydrolase [Candidatus Limnocylindrales bacterium]